MIEQPNTNNTENPEEFRTVEISKEPVELYKILKFEGLVGSGGEAKAAVASGQVLVNGVVETQKRKKIMSGDTVEFGEDKIKIQLSSLPSSVSDTIPVVAAIPKKAKTELVKKASTAAAKKTKAKPTKEKPLADRKAITGITRSK